MVPIYERSRLDGADATPAPGGSAGPAIKYVRRVEELVGCPIALLSTSPEREDTILVQNPFEA